MYMLEVTRPDGRPRLINVEHITSVSEVHDGTELIFGEKSITVKDSVGSIRAAIEGCDVTILKVAK